MDHQSGLGGRAGLLGRGLRLQAQFHAAQPARLLGPHHEPRQLRRRGPPRLHLARHPPAPQDHDAIGDGQGLLELVGDEHHGLPVLLEGPQEPEKFGRLHGGEDACGLVQNEEVHVSREHLEDLHALALAHGELLHGHIKGDAQARFGDEGLELLA